MVSIYTYSYPSNPNRVIVQQLIIFSQINYNNNLTIMTITEKYIAKILPYLDEKVDTKLINGLKSYEFACPWCSYYINSPKYRNRKCASLVPIQGSYDYKFICMRSGTPECRRIKGGRSFHNFLAMYNPALFREYKKDLEELKTLGK